MRVKVPVQGVDGGRLAVTSYLAAPTPSAALVIYEQQLDEFFQMVQSVIRLLDTEPKHFLSHCNLNKKSP